MKSRLTDIHNTEYEHYYNKLPDYYTGLSPAINTIAEKRNEPSGKNGDDFYDKIPPYFTELSANKKEKQTDVSGGGKLNAKSGVSKIKINQMEERRVVYVGNVKQDTTLNDLRARFGKFGVIEEVKLHFREIGDSYGFVTFTSKEDAVNAIQHGNDDPLLPKYDLCFGGRRHFCRTRYSDLDGSANTISRSFKNRFAP